MAIPAVRAIAFDFDGTLVSGTNAGYIRCYHQAAANLGYQGSYELTERRVLEHWGNAARIELSAVLRESPSLIDQAVVEYERLLDTDLFSREVESVPGAKSALIELRQMGIALAVVSGMPIRLLQKFSRMYDFGFSDTELLSTSETDDPTKQKATGYHLNALIQAHGWRAEETLVVGDSSSDVTMARSQNAPVLVVLTGFFTVESARKLGVDKVLASVAELPTYIRQNR